MTQIWNYRWGTSEPTNYSSLISYLVCLEKRRKDEFLTKHIRIKSCLRVSVREWVLYLSGRLATLPSRSDQSGFTTFYYIWLHLCFFFLWICSVWSCKSRMLWSKDCVFLHSFVYYHVVLPTYYKQNNSCSWTWREGQHISKTTKAAWPEGANWRPWSPGMCVCVFYSPSCYLPYCDI